MLALYQQLMPIDKPDVSRTRWAIYEISDHKHLGTTLTGLAVCGESMQLADAFGGLRKSERDADGGAIILAT